MTEDGAVEIDEPEEPGADADREDDRHGGERAAVALFDRGLDRGGGVGQDVPQQEDQDAGGDRVEEALGLLGEAAHPRDGQADEDGRAGEGAKRDGCCLAHLRSLSLVRTKDAIRSV